ncbi:MAG: helix-turn-helix domain-containing protein [Bacteroidales bacterium]
MSKKSAQTIKEFLEKYHVSKVEFAKVTGVSRTSVYKYLAGEPIHPLKAKQIEKRILQSYRVLLRYENLIE